MTSAPNVHVTRLHCMRVALTSKPDDERLALDSLRHVVICAQSKRTLSHLIGVGVSSHPQTKCLQQSLRLQYNNRVSSARALQFSGICESVGCNGVRRGCVKVTTRMTTTELCRECRGRLQRCCLAKSPFPPTSVEEKRVKSPVWCELLHDVRFQQRRCCYCRCCCC